MQRGIDLQPGRIVISGVEYPLHKVNTLIIGSGAAALKAAVRLHDLARENLAIVTEEWGGGTSNNAGSDKQTYYRVSATGMEPDSARSMAADLFTGGCMHGDIALCEASHSVEAFHDLVRSGVPFPQDRYGAFPGYLTDNDSRGRGTSAGPLTSRYMFEKLAEETVRKGIPIFDHHQVISLLTEDKGNERRVTGAVALNLDELQKAHSGLTVFAAENIVLATGGPAGIWADRVYPVSQHGSTGLALSIGAKAQNLTEIQFGIAAVKFRWNLSGSYQQVIPRYFSTDSAGGDEREFLSGHFPDMRTLMQAVFLKGRQWVFDPCRMRDYGSSLIDILVHRERVLHKRRVFIDYTRNPGMAGAEGRFFAHLLSSEAAGLLGSVSALQATPVERLAALNQPAIDVFTAKGIDLRSEPLEIAVCAQHSNGGLTGNTWWESNIRRLFPVGEVNGSHGVRRPGGAALNAGQVGALRAAMYIADRYQSESVDPEAFERSASAEISRLQDFMKDVLLRKGKDVTSVAEARLEMQERMTRFGGIARPKTGTRTAAREALQQYLKLRKNLGINARSELPAAFRLLDHCLTHAFYLAAVDEYIMRGGASRGSYIITNKEGDISTDIQLCSAGDFVNRRILELQMEGDSGISRQWVKIRPIPEQEHAFEKIWKDFREGRMIERGGE